MIPIRVKLINHLILIHQKLTITIQSSNVFHQKKNFIIINYNKKMITKNKLFMMKLILVKIHKNK
jgi:hypothetical protein